MILGLILLGLGTVAASASPKLPLKRGCLVTDGDLSQGSTLNVHHGQSQSSSHSRSGSNITVDVNFHIASTEEDEFLITSEIIDAQWEVLRANFAPFNINLVLNSTERVVDNKTGSAFLVYEGPTEGWVYYEEERNAYLSGTRKGGYDALNMYFFSAYSPGATGYCEFPTVIAEGDDLTFGLDSCQISALTMPGIKVEQGGFETWNMGHIAVHEAGHWFGLNHTFAGGCSETGDFVEDTPAQSSPVYGCPTGSDSCPDSPGLDPIHNFMGYTDDNWYVLLPLEHNGVDMNSTLHAC
jgi:hypothetical protein